MMQRRVIVCVAVVLAMLLGGAMLAPIPAYADHTWAADEHFIEAYGGTGQFSEGAAHPLRRTTRMVQQFGYMDVTSSAGGGLAIVDADGEFLDPGSSFASGGSGAARSGQYIEIDGPPGEVLVRLRARVSGTSTLDCGPGDYGCRLSALVKIFIRSNTGSGQHFTGITDAFLNQGGAVTVMSQMSGVTVSNPQAGVMVFSGEIVTPAIPVYTNEPFYVQLDAGVSASVAERADYLAEGIRIGFPRTGPVFDLPAGYTAHSTSIVNNEWRNPFNVAPQVLDDEATTYKGMTVDVPVLANDSDGDGTELTMTSVSTPSHGSAAIDSGGSIDYSPAPGFSGTDSFQYTATDLDGAAGTATVTVAVLNRAPRAVADEAITSKNVSVTIPVLDNDVDPDGDALVIAGIEAAPVNGSAIANANGTISYTPAPGFVGTDSFVYRAGDGTDTATATVRISVAEDDVAPALSVQRTGPGTLEVEVSDFGSGVAMIEPSFATPNMHVVVPPFSPGASSVIVTITTSSSASAGVLRIRAADRSGNERRAFIVFSPTKTRIVEA